MMTEETGKAIVNTLNDLRVDVARLRAQMHDGLISLIVTHVVDRDDLTDPKLVAIAMALAEELLTWRVPGRVR